VTSTCGIPKLDEAAFEEAVLASPLPVFVHFAERDCEGCDIGRRCLEDIVEQAHGSVKCFCVHRVKNAGMAARYRVERCPTILVFREGRVARRLVGHPLPGELEVILRSEFP
jgi:thioredoxin 1